MASASKCLAQSNKSRDGGKATKKQQAVDVHIQGPNVVKKLLLTAAAGSGNCAMAATNKCLAKSNKTRIELNAIARRPKGRSKPGTEE
jgi:hypothetical protein